MDEPSVRQGDTWQISEVEITTSQTRLYYNGLQQCRILLKVRATRGAEDVPLSGAERRNIRIVDYMNPDGVLPFIEDDPLGNYRGWSAQRTYSGYSYYPDMAIHLEGDGKPTGAARQGPGEWLEFFVSADVNAQNNPILPISFSIRGDDGSVWRTTGAVTYADGSEDYFSHLDLRGREMAAIPPVYYSTDNFQLDRRNLDKTPEQDAALFNDLVTLSIVSAGGRSVGVRSMNCSPAGMIHWVNNLPDTYNPCFTGFASPGQTAIQWNPTVPTGSQPLPRLLTPIVGKGAFILCGRVDIRRGDYIDPPRGPVAVSLIDEFGTQHMCRLAFVAGQRDELRIQ